MRRAEHAHARLLGSRHSGIFTRRSLLHGLRRVPDLRMILILCEPMGRLERFFLVDTLQPCRVRHEAEGRCPSTLRACFEHGCSLNLERVQNRLSAPLKKSVH
mmetsp:Transcript_27804/g.57376  ORF Transcript_27804/g.57376 Transcript_27804/m.57376 type:complete len:103 (-) Transcript_27804:42-350(-)